MMRSCLPALITALLTVGQSGSGAQQPTTQPATAIKGSEQPELIPDREAIALFFLHVSDGPAALPWSVRKDFLAPSGLTAEEIATVINSANIYRAKADAISAKIKKVKKARTGAAISVAQRGQIDSLLAQQQADLDTQVQWLKDELGPDRYAKFLKFIQTGFKPTMIYYPGKS